MTRTRVQDLLDSQGPPPAEVGLDWVWQLAQLRGDCSTDTDSTEANEEPSIAIRAATETATSEATIEDVATEDFSNWGEIQIDDDGRLELDESSDSSSSIDRLIQDAMRWADPDYSRSTDSADSSKSISQSEVSAFLSRRTQDLANRGRLSSNRTPQLETTLESKAASRKRVASGRGKQKTFANRKLVWVATITAACAMVGLGTMYLNWGTQGSGGENGLAEGNAIQGSGRENRSTLSESSASVTSASNASARTIDSSNLPSTTVPSPTNSTASIDPLAKGTELDANLEPELRLASDGATSIAEIESEDRFDLSAGLEMNSGGIRNNTTEPTRGENGEEVVLSPADSETALSNVATAEASQASQNDVTKVDRVSNADTGAPSDQVKDASRIDVMSTLDQISREAQSENQESELATEDELRREPILLATYPMMQLRKLPANVRVRAVDPAWKLRLTASEGFRVQPANVQTLRPREVVRWMIEGEDADADAARVVVMAQLVGSRGTSIRWRIAAVASDLPQVYLPISQSHLDAAQLSLASAQSRLTAAIEFLSVVAKEAQSGRSAIYAQRRAFESQRKLATRVLEVVSQANQFEGWLDGQLEVHAALVDEAKSGSPTLLQFGDIVGGGTSGDELDGSNGPDETSTIDASKPDE